MAHAIDRKEGDYKGQQVAQPDRQVFRLAIRGGSNLVGIEPSGVITPMFASRAELEKDVANS